MIPVRVARSATIVLLCASAAAQAHPFTDLHDFLASPDGREPVGSVTPLKEMLYGTTTGGGEVDSGTVYRIDPATGDETVLYSFMGSFNGPPDGSAPEGEMVVSDGVLYGTTSFGGQFNAGTLFSFDPATGKEAVLYSFGSGSDGAQPAAGPIVVGQVLYGTTSQGGAPGFGTVFSFDLSTRQEAVLHEFASGDDGSNPFAPLTYADGVLYGTTFFGGASNDGTVFRVDPATGDETVLHAFSGPSFSGNPAAGLVFHDGFLFGTTAHGGRSSCSGGCGTVFRVNAANGKEKDLYRFHNPRDGEDPEGGLVLRQGLLYGTTLGGGKGKAGTIFSVDVRTGTKVTLYNFHFPTGANPGTLTWFRHALFGTTRGGGGAGQGTAFRFAP